MNVRLVEDKLETQNNRNKGKQNYNRVGNSAAGHTDGSNNNTKQNSPQDSIPSGSCSKCGIKCHFQCSACSKTWYCSTNCQIEDWPQHSLGCMPPLKYPAGTILSFNPWNAAPRTARPSSNTIPTDSTSHWKPNSNNKSIPKKKISLSNSINNNNNSQQNKKPEQKVQDLSMHFNAGNFSTDGSTKEVVAIATFSKFPESFYIHRNRDQAALQAVTTQLRNATQLPHLEAPTAGDLCLAQFTDRLWYRASICEVKENKCKVFYLDFGNTETVERAQLRQMDENIRKIPPLALHCQITKLTQKVSIRELGEFAKNKPIFAVDIVKGTLLWNIDLANSEGVKLTEFLRNKNIPPAILVNPAVLSHPAVKELTLKKHDEQHLYGLWVSRSTDHINLSNLEPGLSQSYQVNQLVAYKEEQAEWQRGYIQSWHRGSGTVQLLDVAGPPVKATTQQLAPLPAELCKIPRCACPVVLKDMATQELIKMAKELEVNLFEELVFRAEVEEAVPVPKVVLYLLDGSELISTLTDAMEDDESPSPPTTNNVQSHSTPESNHVAPQRSFLFRTDYPRVSLKKGTTVNMVVSEVKGLDLYGFLDSAAEDLRSIETRLANMPPLPPVPGFRPKIGDLCLAPFSEDDSIYRAVVQKYISDQEVKVVFADYANTEVMDLSLLRPIPPELLDTPLQAFRFHLDNIKVHPTRMQETLGELRHLLLEPSSVVATVIEVREDLHYLDIVGVKEALQSKGLLIPM